MNKSSRNVSRRMRQCAVWVLLLSGLLSACWRVSSQSVLLNMPFVVVPRIEIQHEDDFSIAMNETGDAFVVWSQPNKKGTPLFAKQIVLGEAAQEAIMLDDGNGEALAAQMVMNPKGEGFVTWSRHENGVTRIVGRHFDKSKEWLPLEYIQKGFEGGSAVRAAIVASGDLIVLWEQSDGKVRSIVSRYYTQASGWEAPRVLSTGKGQAFEPQIKMDRKGNAFAVWHQSDGGAYQIWRNRYVVGKGWIGPVRMKSNDEDALHPKLAMNDRGMAIVVWRQFDGNTYSLYASHFSEETWSRPELIESHSDEAIYPDVQMDEAGRVAVLWVQRRCVERRCLSSNIWANHTDLKGVWQGARQLAQDATNPKLRMLNNDSVVATWGVLEGFLNKKWRIELVHYLVHENWQEKVRLKFGAQNAFHPDFRINRNGDVFVAWEEIGSTRRIVARWIEGF